VVVYDFISHSIISSLSPCLKVLVFYRLSAAGQTKAADLTSLLMLFSIATAFKSLLRPSDMTNHEKGPAESLAG